MIYGDTSSNTSLRSGDVILVKPIKKVVSISGAVSRPAIYELNNDENLNILINFSGGITGDFVKGNIELSLDQIIGFVHRYDLVNKQAEDKFNVEMQSLMEPVHTVSDKDSVSDILDQFVKRRQQIFIVADEFGTTNGLITLEDAIETLLGVEIVDEHDSVVDMRKLATAKLKKRQQKERVS